ncbi:MAG: YihY/virulence factor BrkB family protein [Bacteriovoracaceae bacterium]
MELADKNFFEKIKYLINKIYEDNLFLLSSSISYYSALALAPFILILLAVASLLGQNIQEEIAFRANLTSPVLGSMVKIIFSNVNEGLNFGSISGIIGVVVLLWTASLVFLQFRYSFDLIYGHLTPDEKKSLLEIAKDKVFAMLVVIASGVFVIFSLSLTHLAEYLYGVGTKKSELVKFLFFNFNFIIYFLMFYAIHYFVPSRRPKFKNAGIISFISTLFFVIGNSLLTFYLRKIAVTSIYGAAGSLFVFLIWSYYSSFTMFLSIEVFLYIKQLGKMRK